MSRNAALNRQHFDGHVTTGRIAVHTDIESAGRTSDRVVEVAAMFGLEFDGPRETVLLPPCDVPIPRGGIIFITGPSGGGKTTILRALETALRATHEVIVFDSKFDPSVPIVDQFDLPLDCALACLSRAGLSDAPALLRSPAQLSDGQRYRFQLARTIARAEGWGRDEETERRRDGVEVASRHSRPEARRCAILADEFGSTLDRITAKCISRNLDKWIGTTKHALIVATAHDDLLEALDPAVLIYKDLGDVIEVHVRRKTHNARGSPSAGVDRRFIPDS